MPWVNVEDLEETIRKHRIVIADFWAEWCIPCKAVEDSLRRLEAKLSIKGFNVIIARVNVEENPEEAARYGVMGLPTVILFVEGEEKVRHTGGPAGLERKIMRAINAL